MLPVFLKVLGAEFNFGNLMLAERGNGMNAVHLLNILGGSIQVPDFL